MSLRTVDMQEIGHEGPLSCSYDIPGAISTVGSR